MYHYLLRPLLFLLDPERAHRLTMRLLHAVLSLPGMHGFFSRLFALPDKRLQRQIIGLTFANPVGLAAGFDKDARYLNDLAALGFGFIEIGTLTPRPQPGNTPPRLFRLPADEALINRMGFNNEGVDAAVARLRQCPPGLIVGGNIGKNKATPNEQAVADYEYCFSRLFDVVDYFVVNVSSPNTPGLRALQDSEPLQHLLQHLQRLNRAKEKPKPILLKIAPDLTYSQLQEIIGIVRTTGIAGVIATNTTISRQGLRTPDEKVAEIGAGGLSGRPLRQRATEVIRNLRQGLGSEAVIIGVGGIMSPDDALEKLAAGADLVQVFTGFIYKGPALVKQINRAYLRHLQQVKG
ncbi:MAG TPA: quinone-dependent dihydroorotate dehydrogenase [Flammeovirgaceae bacterium]|nr:quinone-dependent dihydroorotate dehydrogenase [Flammeovirgaceae bacterium]